MDPDVLIVEDELLIAKMIVVFLQERGYHKSRICISCEEAIEAFEARRADVVLLDIKLYGKRSGIDFAKYLDRNAPETSYIFVTSQYDQSTIDRTLETNPSGYLVKPVQKESLWTTFELACAASRMLQQRPVQFTISDGTKTHVLYDRDILYVHAEHVYVRIFLSDGSHVLARFSLTKLKTAIASPLLFQCHRSYIINLAKIRFWKRDCVVLQGGETIPVSRSRKTELELLLQ